MSHPIRRSPRRASRQTKRRAEPRIGSSSAETSAIAPWVAATLLLASSLAPFLASAVAADAAATARWSDESADRLPEPVARGGASSMDVEPIDFDGDGDLDLAVAVEFGPNRLLENDGTGHFSDVSAGRLPRVSRDSEDIAVADLDGDGLPDLVFATEDDRRDELYLSDGEGGFTDASARMLEAAGSAPAASNAVLALDLDADGLTDLLFGNAGPNHLYRNLGGARFERDDARLAPLSRTTQDLEAGDIDGDGDLDLVEANEDGNRVLVRGADGTYRDETGERLPTPRAGEETREADLGDVDGDGDLDLYLANVNFRQLRPPGDRLLLNDGTGTFTDATSALLPGLLLHTVDADFVDLDADGDLDLALAHAFGGGLRLLDNDGRGRFVDATPRWLVGSSAARAADGIDVEAFALGAQEGEPAAPLGLYLGAFRAGDVLLVRAAAGAPATGTPAATATLGPRGTPTRVAPATPPRTVTVPAPLPTTTSPPASTTATATASATGAEALYLPRLRR